MIKNKPNRAVAGCLQKSTVSAPGVPSVRSHANQSRQSLPAHMSAHSKATANIAGPVTPVKPQHAAAAQLKKQSVIATSTAKSTRVVQRMQDNAVTTNQGELVLGNLLNAPQFRRELTLSEVRALRGVNKKTKKDIDDAFANPGQWAVLHRLHTHSFTRFVETSLPKEEPDKARRAFEKTDSKYDPSKYGKKHTWLSNLRWLRDVNRKFSHIALTDLPLSEGNIKRQSEDRYGGKRNDFSAYARELAYALLHGGYSTTGHQQNFTYGQMAVQSLHKSENGIALTPKQRYVLKGVLGNRTVPLSEVLVTFAEMGVPVDERQLLEAKQTIEHISYDEKIAKLKAFLLKGRDDKRWPKTSIPPDPQQWPRGFLRNALEAMLGFAPRNAEIKVWRARLHEWYKDKLL